MAPYIRRLLMTICVGPKMNSNFIMAVGVKQIAKFEALTSLHDWKILKRRAKRRTNGVNTYTYERDICVLSIHSYIPRHKSHPQSNRSDFPNSFHCTDLHTLYRRFQHYILIAKIKWKIYSLINGKRQYLHGLVLQLFVYIGLIGSVHPNKTNK